MFIYYGDLFIYYNYQIVEPIEASKGCKHKNCIINAFMQYNISFLRKP
jgi:hypothetical protein